MNFQQIIILDINILAKDSWNCLTNCMHPTFFSFFITSLVISFSSFHSHQKRYTGWKLVKALKYRSRVPLSTLDKPSIDFLLSSESFDQNIFIHSWNILKGLKNILVIHSIYRRKRVWEDEDRKGWDGWGEFIIYYTS